MSTRVRGVVRSDLGRTVQATVFRVLKTEQVRHQIHEGFHRQVSKECIPIRILVSDAIWDEIENLGQQVELSENLRTQDQP